MKKRILSALLTLCMVLTLLPVSALAAGDDQTGAVPSAEEQVPKVSATDDTGHVNINKSISADGRTLKLEAYVTDEVTSTKASKPMDIVLVLDVSSSMNTRDDRSGDTRLEKLQNAVNEFIDSVAADNVNVQEETGHRISIVTFSDNAQRRCDLTEVEGQNVTRLHGYVDGLRASGNTYPDTGLTEASSALAPSGTDRAKTVIMFTDGNPAPAGTNNFDEEIATDAINAAKTLKDSGATVYTIGMLKNESSLNIGTDIGMYMQAVSSNYPNATAEYDDGWWGIGAGWDVTLGDGSDAGYCRLANEDLSGVFEDIWQDISRTTVQAGENTTLTDTMSAMFTFADSVSDNEDGTVNGVTVYTVSCIGRNKNGYIFDEDQHNPVPAGVKVSLNAEKGIEVTGFDYTTNAATEITQTGSQTRYEGCKLVITIPIKPDTSYTQWDADQQYYATNASAVLDGYTVGKENPQPGSTTLSQSPTAPVTVSTVTYNWGTENVPAGMKLPTNSGAYIEGQTYVVDSTYTNGHKVYTYDEYNNVTGTYTFNGWNDPNNGVMGDTDVVITGSWSYSESAVAKHSVTYSWGDNAPSNQTLPDPITGLVKGQSYEVDSTYYEGYTVNTYDEYNNVTGTYTFNGWNDPNNGVMGDTDVVITGSWTYEDKTPDYLTIRVSFVDSDGTTSLGGGDVTSASPDQKLDSVPTPTAPEGMTFAGWKVWLGASPMYDGKFTFNELKDLLVENNAWYEQPINRVTFQAVYEPELYTIHVSFEDCNSEYLGGGDVISTYPDQVLEIADPTAPAGMTFVGWKAVIGNSPMYEDEFTFSNLSALREEYGQTDWSNNEAWLTFVAVYADEYRVIHVNFVNSDETTTLGSGDVISTYPNQELVTPNPANFTPDGKTFVGWKAWVNGEPMYTGAFTYEALVQLLDNGFDGEQAWLTFEAVYADEEAEYRVIHVSFVDSDETTTLGGGDVISTYPDQVLGSIPTLSAPDGMTFAGWKVWLGDEPMYDGVFTFEALKALREELDGPITWVNGEETWITFEAVYTEEEPEEKTFTVTFDSRGGSTVNTQTVESGKTAVKPADPTRNGYDFEGWFTDETFTTEYDFTTPVTANITLYAAWDKQSSGGGGGGGGSTTDTHAVYYHSNYGSDERKTGGRYEENDKVEVRDNDWWDRDNYRFLGWNTEKDGSGEDYDPDDTFRMPDEDVHLYAQWRRTASDPSDSGTDRWLETQDHRLYMVGYPDDTFGPDRNMTRAEVAQMFYALLLDQNVSYTENFSDVPSDAWYAEAVNTLAALGMIDGYPDGTFRPDATITRAEFCVIALAFAYEPASFDCSFYDVSVNDWFYDYVAQATSYGWISGGNGAFRPNDAITRAEVSVIVNNMLGRTADEDYVDRHEDELITFPDVPRSYWAYYSIMETTNSHDYTKTNRIETWR